MDQALSWKIFVILVLYTAGFGVSLWLNIQLINADNLKKSGIATLKFNFTSLGLSNLDLSSIDASKVDIGSLISRDLPPPDMLTGLQIDPDILNSVGITLASAAATADTVLSMATSVVANSAQSTTAPNASLLSAEIWNRFPHNCSLGTTMYCMWFVSRVDCQVYPLNVTELLSEPGLVVLSDAIEKALPILGTPTKFISKLIVSLVISSLGSLSFLLVVTFLCLKVFPFCNIVLSTLHPWLCLVCLIPVGLLVGSFYIIHALLEKFPLGIVVEKGTAIKTSWFAFGSAGLFTLASLAISLFYLNKRIV